MQHLIRTIVLASLVFAGAKVHSASVSMMYTSSKSACLNYLARVHLKIRTKDQGKKLARREELPVPVVSVGNIAMGGRAKTPTTIAISNDLKQIGLEPVVFTRGYGGKLKEMIELVPGKTKLTRDLVEKVGDEAVEIFLKSKVRVVVGKDRLPNAKGFAEKHKGDGKKYVFILDDGFQRLDVPRDHDLVLVKEQDLDDEMFPKGYLRETSQVLSQRANQVVVLGSEDGMRKATYFKQRPPTYAQVFSITTRAGSEQYNKKLSNIFRYFRSVDLKDHDSSKKIARAMLSISEKHIVLGGKEAVKVIPPEKLEDFFETGFVMANDMNGVQRRFYLADLQLEFPDRHAFFKQIRQSVLKRYQNLVTPSGDGPSGPSLPSLQPALQEPVQMELIPGL